MAAHGSSEALGAFRRAKVEQYPPPFKTNSRFTSTDTWPRLTSQQHLVQQVVYLGQAAELNELELFYHLPGDALEGGQQEQQLSKTTPGVVLTVVNVIFQTHLDLETHVKVPKY